MGCPVDTPKVRRKQTGAMSRGKAIAKLSVGLLLSVLTLWNIYIGFYQVYSTKSMHKLVLTMLLSGKCSESSISVDISSSGASSCLQPLGTWEPVDVIILGVGVMLAWRALRSLFSRRKGFNRGQRRARRLIRIGLLFAVVGIADLFGILSQDGKPLDASQIFGWEAPGPAIAVILLMIGLAFVQMGVSIKRKSSGNQMYGMDGTSLGSRKFLGSAERHLGSNFTVGDLRRALMLDAFEDPFQVNTDDPMSEAVGRTCHYCNGEGCGQCNFSGQGP